MSLCSDFGLEKKAFIWCWSNLVSKSEALQINKVQVKNLVKVEICVEDLSFKGRLL